MPRFRSVTLYVPQPEVIAAWYRQLGYAVRKRGIVQHVSVGYSDLRLIPGNEGAFFHLAFHVRPGRFEAVTAQLARYLDFLPIDDHGTKVMAFPHFQAESVYAHDPVGNIVEWIHRPQYRWEGLSRPEADQPGIAELGVVVSDVPAAVAAAELHLSHYMPVADDFAMLGDDEGLVLLSASGRGWLPTGRPAEMHACSATLAHGEGRLTLSAAGGGIRWHDDRLA